jgi:nucleoside diphosphate kinase
METLPEMLEFLTEQPRKRALYAVDTYFRESLEDIYSLGEDFARWFCQRHALMLVRPDAVVARKLRAVLDWMTGRGFVVVAVARVRLDRHGIRALWQYGLNAASRDRRDAADLYMTATESLLLLFTAPDWDVSPAVMLSRLKGPAHPDRCRPGQLRHDLGSLNYQLNLVHAGDDPADLVRELSVLNDHPTRLGLLRRAATGADATPEADAAIDRLEADNPSVSIDLTQVLGDISAATRHRGPGLGGESLEPLRSLIGQVADGNSHDWRRLLRLADAAGVSVTRWQRIVLATYLLDPYEPGATSLLPDSDPGTSRERGTVPRPRGLHPVRRVADQDAGA